MALKLAVIISGEGTNLQALIKACAQASFPANIQIVISNKENAYGLERAKNAGLKNLVINSKHYANRENFEEKLNHCITEANVELICLAGFMQIFSAQFIKKWHNKIINIHPSLLPAFKGLNVQARAINEGAMFSGCTVHFVREKIDDGPIIIQAAVPVLQDDTSEVLKKRILKQEHLIYPIAVRWIAENRVYVNGDRVKITGIKNQESAIINPSQQR